MPMQGSFVARDVKDDSGQASPWPSESARLVMGDGTATLIVRTAQGEYRYDYVMSAQKTIVVEPVEK